MSSSQAQFRTNISILLLLKLLRVFHIINLGPLLKSCPLLAYITLLLLLQLVTALVRLSPSLLLTFFTGLCP